MQETKELSQTQMKFLFSSNKCNQTQFPDNLTSLTLKEHILGGSGGVYILQDSKGKLYTFKAHESLGHLQEEIISDALYQALNCPVPDFAVITQIPACLQEEKTIPKNGLYRLAEFIPSDPQKDKTVIQEQLSQHFLVDAFLSNWDIAVDLKNVILGKNGVLYRIDNGGALRYHAIKGLKTQDSQWSAYFVNELETLRNPDINKDAAKIYGSVSPEELDRQHKELLKGIPQVFDCLNRMSGIFPGHKIDELQSMITARLYDLGIRLQTSPHPYALAFKNLPADKQQNSASILVTSVVDGVPCVLLGQRIRHQWYGYFGGASEFVDGNLFVTACRETDEETAQQLNISPAFLENYPSHDLIIEAKAEGIHTHRMFIVKHAPVSTEELLTKVKASSHQEHTDFTWVPIKNVLDVIKANKTVTEEGQETLSIAFTCPKTAENKKLSLFPPMVKMLQQLPVKNALQHIHYGRPLGSKRTRSHERANYSQFKIKPKVVHISNDFLPVRRLKYKGITVEDTVYPDVMQSDKTLGKQVVASYFVNQEIKGLPKKETLKETKEPQVLQEIKELPTQSIAHLQIELNKYGETDAQTLVDEFFKTKEPSWANPDFPKILIDVVQNESNFKQHAVLYHATNAQMGFASDVISLLRSCLRLEQTHSLRAFDEVFAGLDNVEAFLKDQCEKQGIKNRQQLDNYEHGYQEKGLSCNFGLFFNHSSDSSSTFDSFRTNTARTMNQLDDLKRGLVFILNYLQIKSVTVKDLMDLYEKHERQLISHLYQIFIKEDKVDEYCYYASYLGRYHSDQVSSNLLPTIHALRENPQDFSLKMKVKETNHESMQARLFMHPKLMYDAEAVTIKRYTWEPQARSAEKERLFKAELNAVVQKIAAELLQRKQDLQSSYQSCTQNGLTPLQKKYAQITQDVFDQTIQFKTQTFEDVSHQLDSNNLKGFEQALKNLADGFDLTAEVVNNFSGNKQQSLLDKVLQKGDKAFINILFESKHFTSDCCEPLINKLGHDKDLLKKIFESQYFSAQASGALYRAIKGDQEFVKRLLRSKLCSPDCLENINLDALYRCYAFKRTTDSQLGLDLIALILECDGVPSDAIKQMVDSAIHTDADNGAFLKALLHNKNFSTNNCCTLINYAVKKGDRDFLKQIMQSKHFSTPDSFEAMSWYAIHKNDQEFIQSLRPICLKQLCCYAIKVKNETLLQSFLGDKSFTQDCFQAALETLDSGWCENETTNLHKLMMEHPFFNTEFFTTHPDCLKKTFSNFRYNDLLNPKLFAVMVTLNEDLQKEVLLTCYKNNSNDKKFTVLQYVEKHHPECLPDLLKVKNALPVAELNRLILKVNLKQLMEAIKGGNLAQVMAHEFLDINAVYEEIDYFDGKKISTPLTKAIWSHQKDILKFLLLKEVRLDTMADGRNPIEFAKECAPDLVPILLMHLLHRPLSEQVKVLPEGCNTVLDYINTYHRPLLVNVEAIKSQLSPEQQSLLEGLQSQNLLQSSLFDVSKGADLNALGAKLEEKGVDINSADQEGLTLLHRAIKTNNKALISFLLARGADLYKKNNAGLDSMHLIAQQGIEFFESLVQSSEVFAQMMQTDRLRMKAYFNPQWISAITETSIPKAKALLQVFPDYVADKILQSVDEYSDMKDAYGYNYLIYHYRSSSKERDSIKALMCFLFSYMTHVESEQAVLYDMYSLHNPELMLSALKFAVCLPLDEQRIALGNWDGYSTVLDYVQCNCPHWLETLLTQPKVQDIPFGGLSLLSYAIETKNPRILNSLLSHGYDIRNPADGRNPILLARDKAPELLPDLFIFLLKRPIEEQKNLMLPLGCDVLEYVYKSRPLLIKIGQMRSELSADLQQQFDLWQKKDEQKSLFNCLTPPHDYKALEDLLEKKADIHCVDEGGMSLIEHATKNKSGELMTFLLRYGASVKKATAIICSTGLTYLSLVPHLFAANTSSAFRDSLKHFKPATQKDTTVSDYFKAEWISAVHTLDPKAMEVIAVFPEFAHEKLFNNQTALFYWMEQRELRGNETLDPMISLLMLRDLNSCSSGEMLNVVSKLKNNGQLMLNLLSLLICLPLDQQSQALGNVAIQFETIFEFAQEKHSSLVPTLMAIPGAQLPPKKADKNADLWAWLLIPI